MVTATVILMFMIVMALVILMFMMLNKNSMVSVRERTIPTERPPLVDEVIANFCG
jgi:hypothetical protein